MFYVIFLFRHLPSYQTDTMSQVLLTVYIYVTVINSFEQIGRIAMVASARFKCLRQFNILCGSYLL